MRLAIYLVTLVLTLTPYTIVASIYLAGRTSQLVKPGIVQETIFGVGFFGLVYIFAQVVTLYVENRSLTTRLYMATGQRT